METDADKLAEEVAAFWRLLERFLTCNYATYSMWPSEVTAKAVIETVMDYRGLGALPSSDYYGIRREVARRLDGRDDLGDDFFESYDRYDMGLETSDELEARLERIDAETA